MMLPERLRIAVATMWRIACGLNPGVPMKKRRVIAINRRLRPRQGRFLPDGQTNT